MGLRSIERAEDAVRVTRVRGGSRPSLLPTSRASRSDPDRRRRDALAMSDEIVACSAGVRLRGRGRSIRAGTDVEELAFPCWRPSVPKLRLHLTSRSQLMEDPIIWRLGRQYDIITNIRRANVEESVGWVKSSRSRGQKRRSTRASLGCGRWACRSTVSTETPSRADASSADARPLVVLELRRRRDPVARPRCRPVGVAPRARVLR